MLSQNYKNGFIILNGMKNLTILEDSLKGMASPFAVLKVIAITYYHHR